MAYRATTTAIKGAAPLAVIIAERVLMVAADAAKIPLSEDQAYTIAIVGYGAVVAFLNWLKNRKRV
jgi:phosphate/sulfate permease